MKSSLIASNYNSLTWWSETVTNSVLRFMQLMRQLRDREVEVAGSNMVSSTYIPNCPCLSELDIAEKTQINSTTGDKIGEEPEGGIQVRA